MKTVKGREGGLFQLQFFLAIETGLTLARTKRVATAQIHSSLLSHYSFGKTMSQVLLPLIPLTGVDLLSPK